MIVSEMLSKVIVLVAVFLIIECRHQTIDVGNSCIAQFLKEKELLEDEFPVAIEVDEAKCQMLMPMIMRSLENALVKKLSDKTSIKSDCIMKDFMKAHVLENLLKHEMVTMTKELEAEEVKVRLEEIKEDMRIIFERAARKCDSDPSYGGVFDDVLEIKNESLAVLRQNYCFTKFVVETKLIDVQEIDFNPKKIVTSSIDCQAMIKSNRLEREKKMLQAIKQHNLTQEQIQCIKDKYQIERAFDSNLALEVITYLDVSVDVRRTNRENIARRLESFIKSLFVCLGKSSHPSQPNFSETITKMQF